MRVHGYPSGGEILAVLLMLGGAAVGAVLAIVAFARVLMDLPAAGWWTASAAGALVSFLAWLFL